MDDFVEQAVYGLKRLHRLRDYPIAIVKDGIMKFLKRTIDPLQIKGVRDALFGVFATQKAPTPAPGDQDAIQAGVPPPPLSVSQSNTPAVLGRKSKSPANTAGHEDQSVPAPRSSAKASKKIVVSTHRYALRSKGKIASLQVQELVQEVARLRESVQRLSISRCDDPPVSRSQSQDGYQQAPLQDVSDINKHVEEHLRRLLDKRDAPQAQVAAPPEPETNAQNFVVQRLCDNMAQQQQLIETLASHKEQPEQSVVAVRDNANSMLQFTSNLMEQMFASLTQAQQAQEQNVSRLIESQSSQMQQLREVALRPKESAATEFLQRMLVSFMEHQRAQEQKVNELLEIAAKPQQSEAPQLLAIMQEANAPLLQLLDRSQNAQAELGRLISNEPKNQGLEVVVNFMQQLLHNNMEHQARMYEMSQQSSLAIAASNQENNQRLAEQSTENQRLLLQSFAESAENTAVRLQNRPPELHHQLLPFIREITDTLTVAREALSNSSRPLMICPPPHGAVRISSSPVRSHASSRRHESKAPEQPEVTVDGAASAEESAIAEPKRNRSESERQDQRQPSSPNQQRASSPDPKRPPAD